MIAATLSALPESRHYTDQEWEDSLLKAKNTQRGELQAYLKTSFEKLFKLHSMKIIFGQGDLQEGEEE